MNLPSNILPYFNMLIMRIILLGLAILSMYPAQAMSDAHQQGMSLAESTPLPQPGNPENVPGYAGTDLPQSQIKPHDLGEAAHQASRSSEASQLIAERVEKGEMYVIDPHTDPLILAGNEVVNNPQKTLDDAITEEEGGDGGKEEGKAEIIKCEESGDEYLQKCSKYLKLKLKITPEVRTSVYGCPGHPVSTGNDRWEVVLEGHFSYCKGCVVTGVNVTPKKVEVVEKEWVDGCAVLEGLTEKGLCRYNSKTTSPKNETRMIDGEPIKQDHFEEHFEYACLKASGKSCAGLRERGCYQINSVCKETVAKTCVLWEQTYRCPSKRIGGKSYRSSNKENPFCLSGDCVDKSYEANKDFAEVMSHMSVLKEAGNDFTKFGMIFRGTDRRCTRHCTNFKDCCGNGKGWGVSFNVTSCDRDEKELAELREKKRCIQVGTYCAEKVLGVCIRKKTSFCCYDTKLAKIVQEQGKGQLGLDFGSPQHPQCQGFTPEQLSRIDFSRINFSDIFSDIVASIKPPNPEKIMSGIQRSMANKGSLLKPSIKGLKDEPEPPIQPQPSVGSGEVHNSRTGGTTKPVVSSILNSPSASAMDDNFDASPEEESRIWKQLVQEKSAATIRSEESQQKSTPVKKGVFGGKSKASAYDDDFGSSPISPIVKPSTRPNIAQNSLIKNEEHVSKTLPDSIPKSENQQIQGRNHGEF